MSNGAGRRIQTVVVVQMAAQQDQSIHGVTHGAYSRLWWARKSARAVGGGFGAGGGGGGRGHKHFPPPTAIMEYSGKDMPTLPPKSGASSIFDSEESCCQRRPTSNRILDHDSTRATPYKLRVSSQGFTGGALNNQALAMVTPPSIITDLHHPHIEEQILSPRPIHPDHKLLHISYAGDLEVSPIMKTPSGDFLHANYTVSPLTPEDGSFRGLDGTISERGVDHQPFPQPSPSDGAPRSEAEKNLDSYLEGWEEIFAPITKPAVELPLLGEVRAPVYSTSQNVNRHSDPVNQDNGAVGPGEFILPAKLSLKHTTSVRIRDGPSRESSDSKIPAVSNLRRTKSDVSNGSSLTSSKSAPKVSFALDTKPGFSGRPRAATTNSRARSRPKPKPLNLSSSETDGRLSGEPVLTPYPEEPPTMSSWEYDEEDGKKAESTESKMTSKRMSWRRPGNHGGTSLADASFKSVGKLYTRAKEAGGDVMIKVNNKRESMRISRVLT
jgi:hypothetical protein